MGVPKCSKKILSLSLAANVSSEVVCDKGELVHPVSEHLFGLWLEILAWIWQGFWPGPRRIYALVATLEGCPMLKGINRAAIVGVGVATTLMGCDQFCRVVSASVSNCSCLCLENSSKLDQLLSSVL